MQLRGRRRVDGVGRPKFDAHTGYNELATMTIKKTSAVTQSVANTAKRVIVIIGVALVMGESLPAQKLVGSAICIGGVMLYSIIDDLMKK